MLVGDFYAQLAFLQLKSAAAVLIIVRSSNNSSFNWIFFILAGNEMYHTHLENGFLYAHFEKNGRK